MSYMHGRQKQLYGAPEGGWGGCQLRSTSKKQGGNRVKRAGQHGLHFVLFGNGVSGGGCGWKDGGCQGASLMGFLLWNQGTYKVAPSLPENDTDWRWSFRNSLQKMKNGSWWGWFSASLTRAASGRRLILHAVASVPEGGIPQEAPCISHLAESWIWQQSELILLIFQILWARDQPLASWIWTWELTRGREYTHVNRFLSSRHHLKYFSYVSCYVTCKEAPSEAESRKWLNQRTKNSSMTLLRTLPPRVSHPNIMISPGLLLSMVLPVKPPDNRQGWGQAHMFSRHSLCDSFWTGFTYKVSVNPHHVCLRNCHFYMKKLSVYLAHEELFWEAKETPVCFQILSHDYEPWEPCWLDKVQTQFSDSLHQEAQKLNSENQTCQNYWDWSIPKRYPSSPCSLGQRGSEGHNLFTVKSVCGRRAPWRQHCHYLCDLTHVA